MALTLTDPHLDVCQPCPLKHTDCSGRSKSLPGKPDDQRMKLFGAELHLGAMSTAGPVKLALSQPASSQSDAKPVMNQDFKASGATVCKQISAVRLRRTEDSNESRQRGLSAGAHIHGLGGQPDRVDADHEASPRTKRAHPSGSEAGHFTVMVCSPKGSSMIADASVCLFGATFTGTNAGSVAGG